MAEGLTVLEDSEPHSILRSVSWSHHLCIPGPMQVDHDEDMTDWDHLNWEPESLGTEHYPNDRVVPEYDTLMKPTVESPAKEMSLETSLERKQAHGASAIYEGPWWQISSTPALSLEDAQPVWLSDSSQTRDVAPTSLAANFPSCNDMPLYPRPSLQPAPDGWGHDPPIPDLVDSSQCLQTSPSPRKDVRHRARMSSAKVEKGDRINQLEASEFQYPRLFRRDTSLASVEVSGTSSDKRIATTRDCSRSGRSSDFTAKLKY